MLALVNVNMTSCASAVGGGAAVRATTPRFFSSSRATMVPSPVRWPSPTGARLGMGSGGRARVVRVEAARGGGQQGRQKVSKKRSKKMRQVRVASNALFVRARVGVVRDGSESCVTTEE